MGSRKGDNPHSGDGASPGKIFVGGLAKDTSLDTFVKHFEKYGEITDSVIMKDRHTGRPRGFGFITYADPSAVDTVMKDVHVICGKEVEIKRTIPKGMGPPTDFKTKKIFVGGIPTSVTEDEFESFFSKYGKVVEHEIIRDHVSKRSRGFGFVVFDSERVVDDLLAGGNMIDMADTKSETGEGSASVSSTTEGKETHLKIKEQEAVVFQDEMAANQGVRIRRRPPSGPPLHYVGPFEFRLQNEGNTPRNILEEIVWHKDKEVFLMKERRPLAFLKKALDNAPPTRDFVGALKAAHQRTGLPSLIAEVKKASPSKGILREDFDPVEIAQAYEKGGAACLSVLTDEKYFKGSFENLEAIRGAGVKCPLLCKEFIVDAWQLYNARVKGADAVLLIAAVLPDPDIKYMTKICKMLGLATLVEVHNEREMDRVLAIEGVELVGINNRNLETFEVDINNTKKLLEGERGELIRRKDILVVGESGLFTPEDIACVQEAGVKAVLVGESIVKHRDPRKGISELFGRDISV